MADLTDQPDVIGSGWCPECRSRRDVVDQFDDARMDRRGEMGFKVTVFSCGHTTEGAEHVVAPAPGAPYAGPQTVVAASHRPSDLAAARAEQGLAGGVDPWN